MVVMNKEEGHAVVVQKEWQLQQWCLNISIWQAAVEKGIGLV